jgi:hypothetical protein
VEMINLVTYVARLIENEWERFTTVAAIVSGFVFNEELDLQSLVKRLAERGVDPYLKVGNKESSPIMQSLVETMMAAIQTM